MNNENKKEEVCCDMRGMLSFLILFFLSKKPMNGQEIALEIEKRKDEKPSPGTIYPALKHLREEKFIHEKKEGKTVNYTLTDLGKEALKTSKEKFSKIFTDVLD